MVEAAHTLNSFFKKQQNDNLNWSRKYVVAAFKEIAEKAPANSNIPVHGIADVVIRNGEVAYLGEHPHSDNTDGRYDTLVQVLFNKQEEKRVSWPQISDIELMDNVLNDAAVTAGNVNIRIEGKNFPSYYWEVGSKNKS
jgi:hypothetical protein